MQQDGFRRVAGCDLGKATAKFVVGTVRDDGDLKIDQTWVIPHEGQPFAVFGNWYREQKIAQCSVLGATGFYSGDLSFPVRRGANGSGKRGLSLDFGPGRPLSPVYSPLPEDACLKMALAQRPDLPQSVNLVSIGARGYSVISRSQEGQIEFLENDKCSSGTGETMVKIAGRFGLSVEEAGKLATVAKRSIPITARCSVFAKSEMTHFGNQGKPAAELFRGYFESVARYAVALLARTQVPGPIVLIGGGSRIQALVDAFSRLVDAEVLVFEDGPLMEALGATHLAAKRLSSEPVERLPANPAALVQPKSKRIAVLEPARQWAHRVRLLEAVPVQEEEKREPAILGLDLGSTGSKAVLTSIATGRSVLDVYDRTRGNPVDAARRLVDAILGQVDPDIRAIGVTGSGREAVATVLRATYPEMEDRIVVINEIVAHATAALECDDSGGQSLSVVEIGGQDAKFIQIAGGRIVESDMNKACSAGTGSFLEEQAIFYGVDDITEFTRMARQASRPPDLGQMCTVFVAETAAQALNEGFSIPDIFSGFQYSVIHNYINRVMGQRTFGDRIFFQGKPATSPSLAWTLAAVTGREVLVPPNPGAMGAWGIGLCAISEAGRESLEAASPFDLNALLQAAVVGRGEIRCRDSRCATLCIIDKTTVEIGGNRHSVLSGGACPKFEVSTATRPKLAKEAPDAFEERLALLAPYFQDRPGTPVVGLPVVGPLHGVIPWLATLLTEAGLGVRILRSGSRSLGLGEERCHSYDTCAPVKVAHGVADADVDLLLMPKIVDLPDRDGQGGNTCPMEQALPEMIQRSLEARGRKLPVFRPVITLKNGFLNPGTALRMHGLLQDLGASPFRAARAIWTAARRQQEYEQKLAKIGAVTLRYGAEHRIPVVVVCGMIHAIHDPATNAQVPRILRQNGVLALPMDCFPVPEEIDPLPRIVWNDSSRALRVALAARQRGGVFPLMLSSFGCGPASFVEQFFQSLMEGYPQTVLESDGHGGSAGYVTRVQAFLHAVRQHGMRPNPASEERIELLTPRPPVQIEEEKDSRLVIFSMSKYFSSLTAAFYRSFGYDAVAAGPNTNESLAAGRRDCSGKECLPYQLIWGSFRKHLEEQPPKGRTRLVQLSGSGAMCRNCMFMVKDRHSLWRMGLDNLVELRELQPEPEFGLHFITKFWAAMVSWDILHQMAVYFRPQEPMPGQVDHYYHHFCQELEQHVAKPSQGGLTRIWSDGIWFRDLFALMERACEAFAKLVEGRTGSDQLRTVLLTGDVYLRLDEFGSGDLIRRLNDRGLQVLLEPLSTLVEYLASEGSDELLMLPTSFADNTVMRALLAGVRKEIYRRAQRWHPWLLSPDIEEMGKQARTLLDRYPVGEAPITLGNTLLSWKEERCDGVVAVAPWGCGPSLVAESLLRHQKRIPILFIYSDGSPLDETRLDSFAFRLQSNPSRCKKRRGAAAADTGLTAAAG